MTIRLFTGFDPREAIGSAVFDFSVTTHASEPVSITRLHDNGLPVGSNSFTLSRFLVPHLCGYKGRAIFADGADMLMRADVAELDMLFDPRFAVQVVRHPSYTPRDSLKYRGTSMQCLNRAYPRKNWASLMIVNCEHPVWSCMGPEQLSDEKWTPIEFLCLHRVPDDAIGSLPDRWNVLADEGQPIDDAAILHWTAGGPFLPAYRDAPGAQYWHAAHAAMTEIP